MAPAASPAIPAVSRADRSPPAAATPSTRLAVESRPSLAPSTAARSQPVRPVVCNSPWDGSNAMPATLRGDEIVTNLMTRVMGLLKHHRSNVGNGSLGGITPSVFRAPHKGPGAWRVRAVDVSRSGDLERAGTRGGPSAIHRPPPPLRETGAGRAIARQPAFLRPYAAACAMLPW